MSNVRPVSEVCLCSPDNRHMFREAAKREAWSSWEIVLFCERCGVVVRSDATEWYGRRPRVVEESVA